MVLQNGDIIGSYRITQQLGQGGMATVYKAYHAQLERYVAIKVMHQAFQEDPNFLSRFQREAKIIARLEHPNIVPVYDFNEHNGQPYLVMKFIEGQTFKQVMTRTELPLVLDMLTNIASALTYGHERGVLHRDIKPSNILVDKENRPYVTDFGLARMAQAGQSTLSQEMLMGTPHYISPEQAKGSEDLGPGTDIYSLGVILYEIAVGRVPFSGNTPYAIVHDHIYTPLPMPTSVNPNVDPDIELVLLKALAKESIDRYQTAVEMVVAFKEAVLKKPASVGSSILKLPLRVSDGPTMPPQQVAIPSPIPRSSPTVKAVPTQPIRSTSMTVDRLLVAGIAVAAVLIVGLALLALSRREPPPPPLLPTLAPTQLAAVASFTPTFTTQPPTITPTTPPTQLPNSAALTRQPPPDQNSAQPPPGGQGELPPDTPSSGPPLGGQGGDPPPEAASGNLPATAQTIELYNVPVLTVKQAQDRLQQDSQNPVSYLALLRAYWANNQMREGEDQMRTGASVAPDPNTFMLTAASLADELGITDVAILICSDVLSNVERSRDPLYPAIRAWVGEFLYQKATASRPVNFEPKPPPGAPTFEPPGLVKIMAARALLTQHPLLAEAAMRRIDAQGSQSAEGYLVQGEIDWALGKNDQAKAEWQAIMEMKDAPEWVKTRANELLEQPNTGN